MIMSFENQDYVLWSSNSNDCFFFKGIIHADKQRNPIYRGGNSTQWIPLIDLQSRFEIHMVIDIDTGD